MCQFLLSVHDRLLVGVRQRNTKAISSWLSCICGLESGIQNLVNY